VKISFFEILLQLQSFVLNLCIKTIYKKAGNNVTITRYISVPKTILMANSAICFSS